MKSKTDDLRELFLCIYRKGIMFGKNNCDKNTGLFSIENHVFGKINSFDKLAHRVLDK
jgi:hypothetical protein